MLAICARKSVHVIVATVDAATLRGADLRNVSLRQANLSGFDLRRAQFSGVSLRGADLYRADLRGADLSGALLEGALLEGALYDASTRWPEGCDPAARGAVLQGPPEPLDFHIPTEAQAHWRGERLRARVLREASDAICGKAQELQARAARVLEQSRSLKRRCGG